MVRGIQAFSRSPKLRSYLKQCSFCGGLAIFTLKGQPPWDSRNCKSTPREAVSDGTDLYRGPCAKHHSLNEWKLTQEVYIEASGTGKEGT